jgi:hypothetical protein
MSRRYSRGLGMNRVPLDGFHEMADDRLDATVRRLRRLVALAVQSSHRSLDAYRRALASASAEQERRAA